jgi:hypothetical protein
MSSPEDAVLAGVVEFVAVGRAVVEFCRADAFLAVQDIMLTSLSYVSGCSLEPISFSLPEYMM